MHHADVTTVIDYLTLIDTWEQIGSTNLWIKRASDPPFSKSMLYRCLTVAELKYMFQKANWCLSQGFYFQNLCFINQVEGGDEWLTIKDDYYFESFSMCPIINRGGFEDMINRLLSATRDQCLKRTY